MKETDLQSVIIRALKKQGGTGLKLSNRFKVGVPDLLLSHFDHGMYLVEVKQISDPLRETFKRQTGITLIQQRVCEAFNRTSRLTVAAQLVRINHVGADRLVLWPAYKETITHEYTEHHWLHVPYASDNSDIAALLAHIPALGGLE